MPTESTPDEPLHGVYVTSAADENGIYRAEMLLGPDRAIPFTASDGMSWTRSVLQAVAYARYDSAVYRQLIDVGLPPEAAAQVVQDMRSDRAETITIAPDLDTGFTLIPGVNERGQGFLYVQRDGRLVGQWSLEDARMHALAVLETLETLTLDTQYLRILTTSVGLDRLRSGLVVRELSNFMTDLEGADQ